MFHLVTLESELRKAKTKYDLKQDEVEEQVTKRMASKPH